MQNIKQSISVFRFALCAAGLLLLAACQKPEPIRIGFVADLSGRNADLGVAGRNGVILALEQRNAAGGIKGVQLELIGADTRQDAETLKQVTTDMVAKKLEVIIGPMVSGAAMAMMPIVNPSRTILLSPTVTTTSLSGKNDNFLRVIDSTQTYARASAQYQFKTLGHRRIAVIYDMGNKAYSESWLTDFRQTFEALGGQVLDHVAFTSGSNASFAELTAALLKPRPDAVLIIGNAVDAALICQQIHRQDSKQSMLLSEWPSTERFIELAGAAAEGVVGAQFINRVDTSDTYRSFRKAYVDRFGMEPGFAGLTAYDAALVVLEAYAQRKSGVSIKDTILEIGTFQGVQGSVRIDAQGDAMRRTYLTVIHNGQFMSIEAVK